MHPKSSHALQDKIKNSKKPLGEEINSLLFSNIRMLLKTSASLVGKREHAYFNLLRVLRIQANRKAVDSSWNDIDFMITSFLDCQNFLYNNSARRISK